MLRYFVGLVLVQLLTVGLLALNAGADLQTIALRAGLPAVAIAFLAALWFRSLSKFDAERDLARVRLENEREREELTRAAERERADITLAAERDRSKVAREAERTIRKEERRVGRRASLQVGLAFAATAGMGVLFVVSELVTLGLLTLTAGGSALGGYLMRWKQTRSRSTAASPAMEKGLARQSPREITGKGTNASVVIDRNDEAVVPPLVLPAPRDEESSMTKRPPRTKRSAPGRSGV